MTCIVGVRDRGSVIIGGDSAGVAGYDLQVRADEKVFRLGEFALGFTTSFRMGQVLRYRLELPPIATWDIRRHMVTSFVDAVRAAMAAAGTLRTQNGVETCGTFLAGVRGQLFEVNDDLQVGVPASGYACVGCGAAVASGAMFATAGSSMTPWARVETALRAAEQHSAGVRGPFVVVSTEDVT